MVFGSGRKATKVFNLFKNEAKVGKMERVSCKFCKAVLSKNGTQMQKHIFVCKVCPDSTKKKYFKSDESSTIKKNKKKSGKKSEKETLHTSDLNQSLLSRSSFIDTLKTKDKVQIDQALARAVYSSNCPFSIFESNYWKNAFLLIRPSYKLPSRKQLGGALLEQEYTRISNDVKEQVLTSEYLGFTCDGWSNIRNESIINFIFTTPQPMFWKALPTGSKSHTGEFMANEMKNVMNEVGAKKILGVVTDNAANMKSAWQILKIEYPHIFFYGCLAHGLNLLFTDCKEIATLKNLMHEAVSVVKDVKRSHKSLAIFKESQNEYKQTHPESKITVLKLPVQTRWGSIVACLESLHDNKAILKRMAISENVEEILTSQNRLSILSEIFWDKIKGFLPILSPIYKAIKVIESDQPQISKVVDLFYDLEKEINDNLSSSPFNKSEEKQLQEILQKRKQFCVTIIHNVTNLINPQFKGSKLGQEDQVEACETLIQVAAFMPDINEQSFIEELAKYRASEKIFANKYVTNSVHRYSPIVWWQLCIGNTDLSKVACRLLSLPATSASVERSFSMYSNIHTKNRNRLLNIKAGKLLYISHNLNIEGKIKESEAVDDQALQSVSENVSCRRNLHSHNRNREDKSILESPNLSPIPRASSSMATDDTIELSDSDHQFSDVESSENDTTYTSNSTSNNESFTGFSEVESDSSE